MLTIECPAGKPLLIDGVVMHFNRRTSVTFETPAVRFLAGSWVMAEGEATTPLRRLYLALQTAYVGPRDDRAEAMSVANALAPQSGTPACLSALAQARVNQFHEALRVLRDAFRAERPAR